MAEAHVLGALTARGQEHLGRRRVAVLLEEVVLDLPHVLDAERVGELDLVERVLDELVLGAVVPGAADLVLVEDPELHVSRLPRRPRRPSGRCARRGSPAAGTSPAVGEGTHDHAARVEHVIAHRLGVLVGPHAEGPHAADAANVRRSTPSAASACRPPPSRSSMCLARSTSPSRRMISRFFSPAAHAVG